MWLFRKRRHKPADALPSPSVPYSGPGAGASMPVGGAQDGRAAGTRITPICSGCARPLACRMPPATSMLPPVYAAIVCPLCNWVECKDCKGSPSDAPCTVCGSPVQPAYVGQFTSGPAG